MKQRPAWQSLLSFLVTIGLIGGIGGLLYYFFIGDLVSTPPRPAFDNEFPITGPTPKPATPAPTTAASANASPTPDAPTGERTGIITYAEGLSIRAEPSREAERIGGVVLDEKVTILEGSGGDEFYRVKTSGGVTGWILGFGVKEEASSPSPDPTSPETNASPTPAE